MASMAGRQAIAWIGTSGYSYPHWRGAFYPPELPAREQLRFYATVFNTVELNVTFYRLPRESTFKTWYQISPPGFSFTLKGSRLITHQKRLSEVVATVALFFTRAALLGGKLGVVLWQLPPGMRADRKRLEEFCGLLQENPVAKTTRHAFEFRHPTWFAPEIYDVLRAYGYALCTADAPRWPCVEAITANFAYYRFHGHERLYASSYPREVLAVWAEKMAAHLATGRDVYAYFNNDAGGYAVANARELKGLLAGMLLRR
ncbi:DUF72 domain-containing protein [Thermodesulfitimonas autotrophica]|uniref:DUF72 domain-containing protein n=1 Tax=Thermodesulfitimonas autotrophica TaxID=1894989 RepID=UPI002FE25011